MGAGMTTPPPSPDAREPDLLELAERVADAENELWAAKQALRNGRIWDAIGYMNTGDIMLDKARGATIAAAERIKAEAR
jgi:hypothetical protein